MSKPLADSQSEIPLNTVFKIYLKLNILGSLHFNDFAEANEKNLSDRQKVSLRSLNRIDIRIVTIYFSHVTSVSILINPAD